MAEDKLTTAILQAVTKATYKKIEATKTLVRKTVRAEANNLLKWIAMELRTLLDEPPAELFEFVPTWAELSEVTGGGPQWAGASGSYWDYKNTKHGNNAYFFDHGQLAAELEAIPVDRAFGPYFDERADDPARVVFTKLENKTFKITIKLFPRLPAGVTNQKLAELVSNASSKPDRVWGELMNHGRPGGPPRPLLAPALLYFAKRRIPDIVVEVLKANGFKVTPHG